MTTFSNTTISFTLNTNGNFQAFWGGMVDTEIQGLGGWSYVSQTGDVDPSSVAVPAAGAYAGFRVYSTTVGGVTWYMRLDFGRGASDEPQFKIQLGSGVNGSGTLTGQTGTQQTVHANSSGTGKSVFISQAAGRLMILAGPSSDLNQTQSFGISVHADIDATGAVTTTGIQLFGNTSNSWFSQALPASGTVPAALGTVPVNASTSASNVIGSHTLTFHPFLWTEAGGLNPTPAIMAVGTSDSTLVTTMSVSLYSTTRTFVVSNFSSPNGATSNIRTAWLYD